MKKYWFRFLLIALVLSLNHAAFSKSFSGNAGGYDINLSISPFPIRVGDHLAKAQIKDSNGKPARNAEVSIQTDMVGMPMGVHPFSLSETKPGLYEGTFSISMDGLWNLIVRVKGPQGEGKIEFQAETGKRGFPAWFLAILIVLFILLIVWFAPKSSRKVLIALILFIGIALLVFLATRLFLKKPATNPMGMKMEMSAANMGMEPRLFSAPKPVAVETVKPQLFQETVAYSGTVAPELEEIVYPRVIGWLSTFSLYPGDSVKRGDIIAKLDYGELLGETHPGMREGPHDIVVSQLELAAASEKEKQAEAELRKAEADFAYWKKEFPREAFLLKEGAISKSEYDQEKSRYEGALSEMRAQQNGVVMAAREREIAAHAYQIIQDYRTLRAHISGVVTDRMVNQGVLVQPGTPILKIAKLDRLRIQANVSEDDLGKIRVGTPVTIRSSKLPEKILNAKITSVFHQINPASRTGKVEAFISNPDQKLFSGDFVDVELTLSEKQNVLSVPKRALVRYQGGFIVWIVSDRLAERKKVIPGITNGERTEIVSGLKAGDQVIYAGQDDLVSDQPVKKAAWGSGPFEGTLLPEPMGEMR